MAGIVIPKKKEKFGTFKQLAGPVGTVGGAVAGAAVGSLAGGVGAVPGAIAGANIGSTLGNAAGGLAGAKGQEQASAEETGVQAGAMSRRLAQTTPQEDYVAVAIDGLRQVPNLPPEEQQYAFKTANELYLAAMQRGYGGSNA